MQPSYEDPGEDITADLDDDLDPETIEKLRTEGIEFSDWKPNQDLIGFEYRGEFGWMKVVGVAPWNAAYVEVETLDGKLQSVRPAGHVRLLRDAGNEENLDNRDEPDPIGAVVDRLSPSV